MVNMKAVLPARDLGKIADRVESIIIANGDTRDGAIDEDKNGSDGVGMFLDLSRNIPLIEFVLLKPLAFVGQPRGVEDANHGRIYAYLLIVCSGN